MITGKTRLPLSGFQAEMDALIGDHAGGYGVTPYFESLHNTFSRAISALALASEILRKEIDDEDLDTRYSILKSQESLAYPLLQTLYTSYFVTLHSELERIWNKVILIYNEFYQPSISRSKLNSTYFNNASASCFIDETLMRHKVLFTYNYIRNGMIHAKNNKTSTDFTIMESYIREGTISAVEIIETDSGFDYLITGLEFGKRYADEILAFLQDLGQQNNNNDLG